MISIIKDYKLKLKASIIHCGEKTLKDIGNPKMPLVTIYTPVKNSADTLNKTIRSVINQDYKNIEYIVIDGKSTDGTIDIIRKNENHIDKWISEPDQGTSDAGNKALSLGKGTYFCLLNADDWIEYDYISQAISMLVENDLDFVVGQTVLINEAGEAIMKTKEPNMPFSKVINRAGTFCYGQIIPHKRCYEHIGLLDTSIKYSNDVDWLIRLYKAYEPKAKNNPKMRINRLVGGFAEANLMQSVLETISVLKKHQLPIRHIIFDHLCFILFRIWGKSIKFLLR